LLIGVVAMASISAPILPRGVESMRLLQKSVPFPKHVNASQTRR